MLSAIGLSPFPDAAPPGKSTAGLEAKLARYQTQLADWRGSPSCKTPEGKAKIAEISDKINAIKSLQEAADPAARKLGIGMVEPPDRLRSRENDAIGNRLNVYA
jgi:hypothetical protein